MPITITLSGKLDIGDPIFDFTVFDGYLGSRGLVYYEDDNTASGTESQDLRPTRTDVGNNPLEIRPEEGDPFAQADFSHGANQTFYHRPGRDEKRYYRSEGFDIEEAGLLRHLPRTTVAQSSSTIGQLSQAVGLPFVADGNNVDRGDGNFPGTWTAEDPHAGETAMTVRDLASSGDELYAALGTNGVHKRNAAGTWAHLQPDGATNLSGVGDVRLVAWLKDRLIIVGDAGRGIYEIVADSTPPVLETLPVGWIFTDLFELGEFIYAPAVNTGAGLSRIHRYSLDTAGNLEKIGSDPMPQGQLARSGTGYIGQALVGGGRQNTSGGEDPILYLMVPDDNGALSYALVAQGADAGVNLLGVQAIAPQAEAIFLGWSNGADGPIPAREGLAIYYLGRDAFAHHQRVAGSVVNPKAILSVLVFEGRVLFSVDTKGLYYADLGTPETDATLWSSAADWNNAGLKEWDRIELAHNPLPAATSVDIDYTTKHPSEDDYTNALISQVDGAESAFTALSDVRSTIFGVRLVSHASGTVSPEVLSYSVRSFPTTDRPEYTLRRYIQVFKGMRKDSRGEIQPGDPAELRGFLQTQVHTRVKFYEPDTTWSVRVDAVNDVEPIQARERVTQGEPGRSGWIMELVMTGTRT